MKINIMTIQILLRCISFLVCSIFGNCIYASDDYKKPETPRPSLQVHQVDYQKTIRPQTMSAGEKKEDPCQRCPKELKELYAKIKHKQVLESLAVVSPTTESDEQDAEVQEACTTATCLPERQSRSLDIAEHDLIEPDAQKIDIELVAEDTESIDAQESTK